MIDIRKFLEKLHNDYVVYPYHEGRYPVGCIYYSNKFVFVDWIKETFPDDPLIYETQNYEVLNVFAMLTEEQLFLFQLRFNQ